MRKNKAFRALLIAVIALLTVMSLTVTAFAAAPEAAEEVPVTVESATVTSSTENGGTVWQLNVKVKNNASEEVDGKVIGLKTYVQIALGKSSLFTFNDDVSSGYVGTLEPYGYTPVDAYGTQTITFDITPVPGAEMTSECELDYTVMYYSVSTTVNAGNLENVKYSTASGTVTVNKAVTKGETIINFLKQTGFYSLIAKFKEYYPNLIMLAVSFVLMYLAIVKKFEPLLLLPIAFGVMLTNLPGADMYHEFLFAGGHVNWEAFSANAGLLDYLYLGVKLGIYPCLIFIGVGAMTDFGPLIANPKSLMLGAAAQLGIFATFVLARFAKFTPAQSGSISIIGGADGPTAIFVTSKLSPELLGPIAIAAYSYMALVPVIQPPIMKLLTTKKEREIEMKELRSVSKREKIVFPIAVTAFVALLVPSAAPLVGCLMLGNLLRECGVTERLSKTVQNELMNIVTIFLGISVGATATAATFLSVKTLLIIVMGVLAFSLGTAGGVLFAKLMNLFLKEKINPLIGSAGVSAVPMAARVSQVVGQKSKPGNYLLMHAMGPNVAGVIGSAIAAGVLLSLFGM